jgi:DNA-binding NarL/FixJ family response regulator
MLTTIAIADDHLLIAKALTEIIVKLGKYEVLYEVENGKELMERFAVKKNIPQIVLLDVSMPVMNGFETAAWLKANYPEVLVMALSMQDEEQSLIKMIKCGASGYLLKNIHPKELDHALQTIIEKGFYYPDWATSKVLMNLQEADKKATTLISFTGRELELFTYVCSEMSYKEISEKMFCSPRTVESYRDSLFEKLNLKSRVGLAVYAMKNGLATEGD